MIRPHLPHPPPFLKVRVHDVADQPGRTALCAGYEDGRWRVEGLVDHFSEWLPEFALTHRELQAFGHSNGVALIKKAAASLYKTKKFENRGELGELLLHIAVRQVFATLPAISKLYYKSARNDTAKGFDAVHIVVQGDDLELWLGEAKFYDDYTRAARDVIHELGVHLGIDYLRDEFAVIGNYVDPMWPHADKLKSLLDHRVSIDEVFTNIRIPVLLTYDSKAVGAFRAASKEYVAAFEQEIAAHHKDFTARLANAGLPGVTVHLFLFPLETKSGLLAAFDEKLRLWQAL